MKKFFTKVIALLSLFAIVACSKDALVENTQVHSNDGTIKEISITGKDFQIESGTRSTVSITENGASFLWNENDVVGIFPNVGDQVSFAMAKGTGTQTATFSGGGWALKSSATYAAYYPHVYENRDRTKIPVNYAGQTQIGNANTEHIGAYDFMAASVTTPSNGAVGFDMQHLGCLVQLKITIPESKTLSKLTLKCPQYSYFTETGTIDLSADKVLIKSTKDSQTLEIRLSNIATTKNNEQITIYFMTAPVNLSNKSLNATIDFEDGTNYETEVTGKNLEAGKAYALEEVDKRLFTSSTTSVKPIQDENGIFLIKSASNLKWFMENASLYEYRNANYKLTTDIIMNGAYWTPIGFHAILDGNGHSIKNMVTGGHSGGLFSVLYGTVKNLILEGATITQSGDNDYYNVGAGALAAQVWGGATIINCGIIGGKVTGGGTSRAKSHIGGLIGGIQVPTDDIVTIKGCFVNGTTIQVSNWAGSNKYEYAGGLIGSWGYSESQAKNIHITSCYTKDIINSRNVSNFGSFIGYVYTSGECSINTCYYDNSFEPFYKYYDEYNRFTKTTFEPLSPANLSEAITNMNAHLTDCDYIFGEDGLFVKRQ